ncbi:MAG: hypothetical protein PHS49_00540 [Candidatus Gracilibacteria bacterium]|nr:hypothetical protein [Candidatus Gracilibacteria bacterium]
MKQKYNWHKLKLEYFTSPKMEVKEFFESKYSTYSGHIKSKTNGWRDDKNELIKKCKNQAENELRDNLKEIYKPSIEELSNIYKSLMFIIRAKVVNLSQNIIKDEKGNITLPSDLNIRELKIIWEIIRTEMGLPVKFKHSKIDFDISIKNIVEDENIIIYKK